jgi:hypothetical protein
MKKEDKHTQILLWVYRKQENGFTWDELTEKFALTNTETNWAKKIFNTDDGRDRKFFERLHDGGDIFALNEKGMMAALAALESQQSKKSNRVTMFVAGFGVVVSILTLGIAYWTGVLTQKGLEETRRSLELTAPPMLSISLDHSVNSEDSNKVTIAAGLLPAKDSTLKLRLLNNSIPTVEDVDIRMTLWKIYVDEESRHLNVCPFGYVNHTKNPLFYISSLQTDNLFNKKFLLKEGGEYPFVVDFSNLKNAILKPKNTRILLKVDVNFVKSASQTSHSYIKLYSLNLLGENVVDVNLAPDLVLALNDQGEEKEIDGFKFPAAVYPFREEEFLNYFKNPTRDLDLLPSACREFILLQEQKFISY